MEIMDKLRVLSDAAKYDVSCSSSGSSRKNAGALGAAAPAGICHSWAADGRCISLLKILMTNYCIYDCEYCINRHSNDIKRAILTPEEIVKLTIQFYRRNYIEGLFLSSGVVKSPNYTTELLIKVAKQLRLQENFTGYIHMKGIPGTDEKLIRELGLYVDRMSVNMELPSEKSLNLLAPQKSKQSILTPMKALRDGLIQVAEEKKLFRHTPSFVPAGQTTQLIVGATEDSDRHILLLSEALYQKISLKRVYYSAYVPVMTGKNLPTLIKPPLLRENRLYQADWLLRFYQFRADEILSDAVPNFDLDIDPKTCWALRNPEQFPLEINRAPYAMLLRVPGIGVRSAKRITAARRQGRLSYEHLKQFNVVLRRAKHFITCDGKYYGTKNQDPVYLKQLLLPKSKIPVQQMSLFEGMV